MNISTCDKRIPNIFAYSEIRTKVLLIVLSIGEEEQVSTVAKPELKVAVIISGSFRYINSILYAQKSGKTTPKMGLIMGTSRHKDAHVHCILLQLR
jgi:hypothetical protein